MSPSCVVPKSHGHSHRQHVVGVCVAGLLFAHNPVAGGISVVAQGEGGRLTFDFLGFPSVFGSRFLTEHRGTTFGSVARFHLWNQAMDTLVLKFSTMKIRIPTILPLVGVANRLPRLVDISLTDIPTLCLAATASHPVIPTNWSPPSCSPPLQPLPVYPTIHHLQ